MIRFERSAPGKYAATRDGLTLAHISRFAHTTYWIAWDARTQHAIRGPFGLGGSPFRTLAKAKATIREQYG
jgi:hypothetical protein